MHWIRQSILGVGLLLLITVALPDIATAQAPTGPADCGPGTRFVPTPLTSQGRCEPTNDPAAAPTQTQSGQSAPPPGEFRSVRPEGVPFVGSTEGLTTERFVEILFGAVITIAALLVVVRLMYAGVQYMFSDVITSKEKAKNDILYTMLGLIIILGSVTILRTINPQLVTLDFFNPENRSVTPPSTNSGAPPSNNRVSPANCGPGSTFVRRSDGTGSCVQTNPEAVIEQQLDEAVDNAITTGDFSSVVEEYDLDSIPLIERQDYVSTIWPTQCEEDANGEETGNEFTEVGGATTGGIRYLCVRP